MRRENDVVKANVEFRRSRVADNVSKVFDARIGDRVADNVSKVFDARIGDANRGDFP